MNDESKEKEAVTNDVVEPVVSTRKVLDKKYLPAVNGIVKRIDSKTMVELLTCESKKEHVLEYSMNGVLPEKPTAVQLVTRLYFGTSYEYGKATDRKTIEYPANPELVERLFQDVPEEELIKKATILTTSNKAVKKALRGVVLSLHAANFNVDAISKFDGIEGILTREEIVEIVSPNEIPGTSDADLNDPERFPIDKEKGIYTGDAGKVVPTEQPVSKTVVDDGLPF